MEDAAIEAAGRCSWVREDGARADVASVLAGKAAVLERLGLRLSDTTALEARMGGGSSEARAVCAGCGKAKNNRVYCYECIAPLEGVPVPRVELPLQLVVIRHPREKRTKSTALHAQVVAGSDQVVTLEVPLPVGAEGGKALPALSPSDACVIFPSDSSTAVSDLPNLASLRSVVVLDATWANSRGLDALPELAGLPRVHLRTYETLFWRHQNLPDTYLATIEAMRHFFVEHWAATHTDPYDGRYDDLLAIYIAQFRSVLAATATASDHQAQAPGVPPKPAAA